jgi:hypothetical protein
MSSQNFSGSMNAKCRKDFLQGLAQSLGLLHNGTNRDIADRISTHFIAHPELYEQVQYQGLATYGSQSIASNSVATAIADVFRNNEISVGRDLAKILKIFEKIDEDKSRGVI